MSNNTTEIDEKLKEIGCIWSDESNVWLYGHGMGWTSQIEPELAAKLHKLLVEARIDELEKIYRDIPANISDDGYQFLEDRIKSLKASLEGEEV